MEPANLNSSDDARLEAWLRSTASPPPDGGFSARVLAALPPPTTARLSWPRIAACLIGAVAGSGFALWSVALSGGSWEAGTLAGSMAGAAGWLADPLLGGALLAAVFSLLFAFRLELRDKLIA